MRLAAKQCINKSCENHDFGAKGGGKINQKGTQERSGKRSWKLGANMGSPSNYVQLDLGLFAATWAISDAILDPAGRQGAPKIDLFGTKSPNN